MRTITTNEFDLLCIRHRNSIPAPTKDEVVSFLARQLPNGKFDYQCAAHLNTEPRFAYEQCKTARALAAYYRDTQDELCAIAVEKNLSYWQTASNFGTTSNWVLDRVIIPRMLIDTLILMGDTLPKAIRETTYQSVLDCYSEERYVHDIGANIVWMNLIWLHAGIYGKSQQITENAIQRMTEEMKFADLHTDRVRRNNHWRMYAKLPKEQEIKVPVIEGVQRDYSFCEHGPLLYTSSYGTMYFAFCVKALHLLAGTDLIPECHYQFIIDYFLEHMQWTYIYGRTDHNTEGRAMARAIAEHSWHKATQEETLPECLDLLLDTGVSYRTDELVHAKEAILTNQNTTCGTHYYPASKYMSHQSKEFSTTLRMTSAETLGSESVCWENIQGWHMGDGVQFIYTNAKNYAEMFPAWDWLRLPGTTLNQIPHKPLDYQQHIAVKGSQSSLCGGVSTHSVGVCGMEMQDSTIHAKKVWLQFPNVCCCLGAEIHSSNDYESLTTLNQTLLQGIVELKTNHDTKAIALGNSIPWTAGTVTHAGLVYTLLEPANASISCQTQTGNYNSVVHDSGEEQAGEPLWISKDVLSLTISHGINPTNESYAYTIQPDIAVLSQPKILRNDSAVQAANLDDYTLAIFWEPSELELKGSTICVDTPCAITLENGMITVGKLCYATTSLQITINNVTHQIKFDVNCSDCYTFSI